MKITIHLDVTKFRYIVSAYTVWLKKEDWFERGFAVLVTQSTQFGQKNKTGLNSALWYWLPRVSWPSENLGSKKPMGSAVS